MKVLIVNTMVPFIWGGAEELAVHLQRNIEIAGHQAEIMRIPFQWEPAAIIPSQMLMWRCFEIYNVDKVIALKFPAYLVRHPDKVLWLLHQYRQAYDLYDAGQTNIPQGPEGDALRDIIKEADNEGFKEAKRIFTISKVPQDRLQHYNGFKSEVLIPPVNDASLVTGGKPGDYIFAGGRINDMKRQFLLIEALALAPKHIKLVIAGPPDSPRDADKLRRLVKKLALNDRVHLDLRFLPRLEIAHYVNNSAVCAYIPYDEDALGYVTLEAATAAKPVITTTDSGGILGLVKHLDTGWVAEPNPGALADAMRDAFSGTPNAVQLGDAMRQHLNNMDLTWEKTVEKLLA